jgi:hypothetical protein
MARAFVVAVFTAFGVKRIPLADLSAALSSHGWPYALRDRAAQLPEARRLLQARAGKPLSREEN